MYGLHGQTSLVTRGRICSNVAYEQGPKCWYIRHFELLKVKVFQFTLSGMELRRKTRTPCI